MKSKFSNLQIITFIVVLIALFTVLIFYLSNRCEEKEAAYYSNKTIGSWYSCYYNEKYIFIKKLNFSNVNINISKEVFGLFRTEFANYMVFDKTFHVLHLSEFNLYMPKVSPEIEQELNKKLECFIQKQSNARFDIELKIAELNQKKEKEWRNKLEKEVMENRRSQNDTETFLFNWSCR